MIGNIEEQGRVDDKRLRIVVIGGGFAGLNFVKHVDFNRYSVTLIDKNNFHCFPPLFYQVASAGLDPASICFPLRRELRKLKNRNIMFNMGEVREIDVEHKRVIMPWITISSLSLPGLPTISSICRNWKSRFTR